ncbi:MAG: hypothetical protein ACXWWF_10260 [Nitrospira sp.]
MTVVWMHAREESLICSVKGTRRDVEDVLSLRRPQDTIRTAVPLPRAYLGGAKRRCVFWATGVFHLSQCLLQFKNLSAEIDKFGGH